MHLLLELAKATFIPENVKKALYKKNDKDQFVLDKSKTLADYKALLGDMVKTCFIELVKLRQ